MYCKYCGNKLDEQAKFCSKCGKLVEDRREVDFFDEPVYVDTIREAEKDKLSGKALTFAIWGLVLSAVSFILFLSGVEVAYTTLIDEIIYKRFINKGCISHLNP